MEICLFEVVQEQGLLHLRKEFSLLDHTETGQYFNNVKLVFGLNGHRNMVSLGMVFFHPPFKLRTKRGAWFSG